MTLQELADRCKGGIYLTINEHKTCYHTVAEELDAYCDAEDMNPEIRQRMIEADTIYELLFYLTSPVSNYIVYGASLGECLAQAEYIITEQV